MFAFSVSQPIKSWSTDYVFRRDAAATHPPVLVRHITGPMGTEPSTCTLCLRELVACRRMPKSASSNKFRKRSRTRGGLFLSFGLLSLLAGCQRNPVGPKASVAITVVPRGGEGGPDNLESISGTATVTAPGQQIVLYALNGKWWIQPFHSKPYTSVASDATWNNVTHIGREYAALLVTGTYRPTPILTEFPRVGGDVLAIATVKGTEAPPIVAKTIRFSGYDWIVRAGPNNRGGEMNQYDSNNVSVDEKGYLHLRMGEHNGVWTCAEVHLNRSLGYGTYLFVVQDSAHLEPSAVVGMYTNDERRETDFRSELEIELSSWGRAKGTNANYTVQPYYLPENTLRFSVGAGKFTHLFRWRPNEASFSTFYGESAVPGARELAHHIFTSDTPVPAAETVHIDFYDFFHSKNGVKQPSEVVIEKFQYLP
jgi:hypothetical protein